MFSSQNSQVSSDINYIEDVFSTYLYVGNGSTQTITNNIDLAGKGGLTWIKYRDGAFGNGHYLYDTVRGAGKALQSNLTDAETAVDSRLTSFNSNGFSLSTAGGSGINANTYNYVSWTFRKQPKFFDVQTFTTAASVPTYSFSHNLASTPGCIIIKSLGADDWYVWHTSLNPAYNLVLNQSSGQANRGATWITTVNSTTIASTVTGGPNPLSANTTYVAYIFAHNAGGFGLTGTDNVISCGSFTTDGTGAAGNITLGYEAQWLLIKRSDGVGSWNIIDVMRGSSLTSYNYLQPNASTQESSSTSAGQGIFPTATGFFVGTNFPAASATYIYIAIRRPMKVPTLGTSVFNPTATTATTGTVITTSFPVDSQIIQYRTPAGGNILWQDRLRGVNTNTTENNNPILTSNDTSAESNTFSTTRYWDNTGYQISANLTGQNRIYWNFRRAPGFFDEVCYTGTGSARTVAHNLAAVPELMIVKNRVNARNWRVYVAPLGAASSLNLNTDAADGGLGAALWNSTAPTASVFSLGTDSSVNASADTYVAYLFATAAGVSKVGSYTGTGALQTVACGFTSGARFVLIKRTDSTGDWYVWDSVRGISSGNDPYLLLNDTAAEVTGTNYVDTDTTGFKVTAAAPAGINASGGTYIFLAVA